MIKIKIVFFALLVFLSLSKSNAQIFTGKPHYQILTKRAGNFLGIVNVELFPAIAPNHVKNFDSLVSTQFYDSTAFHRVIPGFMIQGGDPNSRHGPKSTWGYGDPSQPTVNAEFSAAKHLRGILSAARDANINSANSQFFICVAPAPWLNGQYSVYGRVTSGMDIVDTIVSEPRDANDNPLLKIEMFVTYTGSNDSVPEAPFLITPINGSQNIGASKQLTWNTVNDGIIYHLDVSIDSLFSTLFKFIDVGDTYNTVVGLQGSTTYYWRVKANNGGHWSDYSPVWNFSTTMNASVSNLSFLEKGYKLEQNVPNPGFNQTRIKFVVPAREKVSIKLYDASGREITILIDEEKDKGEHQVILDLNKLAAGTYFYRMQAGGVSETKKITVEK